MTLTKVRLLVCIAANLLMGVEVGQACTCMAPATATEALEKSSAVFRGKVTRIYRTLLDRAGVTRTGNHRVKFKVIKRWKGPQAKSIVVVTRLSGEACGFPFEENKEYLVYVAGGPASLETGICTGTKSIVNAESEFEELDQLVVQNRNGRWHGAGQGEDNGVLLVVEHSGASQSGHCCR